MLLLLFFFLFRTVTVILSGFSTVTIFYICTVNFIKLENKLVNVMVNREINTYNQLFDRKGFSIKVNFKLIKRIRRKIEQKFPSLKEYNKRRLGLNYNTFITFFRKGRRQEKFQDCRGSVKI